MVASGPKVSWNIQNKVLFVGIEHRGREHRWKLSPGSANKAAILREIADVLDPPAPRRRARPVVAEQEEWDEDEEWDAPPRSRPRRAQEERRQVRTPYPPVDPEGEFRGRVRPAPDFVEHSHGFYEDGAPIRTPIPEDPDEADSHARLSRDAYEKAQAHIGALAGQDIAGELPIVEARPKATRRSQGLDSQGIPFLSPAPAVHLREDQQIRKRPKINDPSFHYKDTH